MAEEGAGGQKEVQLFEPTYQLGPEEHERFRASAVKKIAEEVLAKYLAGVTEYTNSTVSANCEDICETIKKRVKEECFIPRYKLVCQVVLGEMKDQGVRVTSRCLWDPDSDNYASAYFKNNHVWGCAMVFGLYTE